MISKCEKIKQYLEITGTTEEAYEIVDKYLNIEFIKTEHVKELDAYGFRMNVNNKNILYTGDTAILESFRSYLENCDELYVDVSKNGGVHLKFEETIEEFEKIKQNGTKIFLMHIDDENYIRKINNNRFYM